MTDDLDQAGPIDYLVVEFPGNKMTGEAFPILVDLVDRGIIRILDLVFVRKELDGSVVGMAIADFDGTANSTSPSSREQRPACWTTATSTRPAPSWSRAALPAYSSTRTPGRRRSPPPCAGRGGQLVASGRIPVQAILAALDAEPVG